MAQRDWEGNGKAAEARHVQDRSVKDRSALAGQQRTGQPRKGGARTGLAAEARWALEWTGRDWPGVAASARRG